MNVYRKAVTVRVPFLRVSAIPPEVMLCPDPSLSTMAILQQLGSEDDPEVRRFPFLSNFLAHFFYRATGFMANSFI